MGKMTVSLGNPFLILLRNLGMLLFGRAIDLFWKAKPTVAFCVAGVAALIMVIDDMALGILWFWLIAKTFANIQQSKS